MRITMTTVVLIALLAVPHVVHGQRVASNAKPEAFAGPQLQRPASLELERTSLDLALQALHRQSGVNLLYSPSQLPRTRVSCDCKDLTVEQALDQMLKDTRLRFQEVEEEVVIVPARAESRSSHGVFVSATSLAVVPPPPLQPLPGHIAGTVTDAQTNGPITTASVVIEGTEKRSLTDSTGQFRIEGVEVGGYRVTVSSIGYRPATEEVEVSEGATVTLDFALEPQALELAELVAVGYGKQQRQEITSAVASVSSEEFIAGPARDAASLIAAQLPGLSVTTPSGDPVEGSEIMLRGVTTIQGAREPLVLIDGVPGRLDGVATQDIESIAVLKDGSAAAIYGSRASNGVILITTKQHAGGGPTFHYDGYVSQQWMYRTPDLLTAADHKRMIDEGYPLIDLGYETDWVDELTREPVSYRHDLSFSGGSANTNYAASLTYENT